MPKGTVTFLFSDIEGSTSLWEHHPDQMKEALAVHDEMLRDAIESNGGHVFKTVGDSFCAAFHTAIDGIHAAVESQLVLRNTTWNLPDPLRVRIGIHTGEAVERNGDYYGQPVNRAARIESAAHGGQTVLSLVTAELVRDVLPESVSLLDLGMHRLRDLTRLERVYQLVHPAFPETFPPLRSLDLRPHNLPVQPTVMIGREDELRDIRRQLIERGTRLVTLVGVGGIGKTRLALQAAADSIDLLEDGVFFIDLSDTTSVEKVPATIARAMSINVSSGADPFDSLRNFLERKELLILLDNFEQVIKGATLVGELMSACPGLRVMVTSREPLRIRGETVIHVPPLKVPDGNVSEVPGGIDTYDSVVLFIDRALEANPYFNITNENAPAVAAICARLEGIPLAIELAAARIPILTPEEILDRLSERLRFLSRGARDLPSRQRAMRTTLEWSYELLSTDERSVFLSLSVFPGSFDLSAAEAMCGNDVDGEVIDLVESLVDKNLLHPRVDAEATRFEYMGIIRELGIELLETDCRELRARERRMSEHYFRSVAEGSSFLHVERNHKAYIRTKSLDLPNIRRSYVYLLDHEIEKAAVLAAALWPYWHSCGFTGEGISMLETIIANSSDSPVELEEVALARARFAAGVLAIDARRFQDAAFWLSSSSRLFRRNGLGEDGARADHYLGWIDFRLGAFQQAEIRFIAALGEAVRIGNELLVGLNENGLGTVYTKLGRLEDAGSRYESALRRFRELRVPRLEAGVLGNLAMVYRLLGRYESAVDSNKAAIRILEDLGEWNTHGLVLNNLAYLFCSTGRLDQAEECYRRVLDLAEAHHIPPFRPLGYLGLSEVCLKADRLDDAEHKIHMAIRMSERYGTLLDLGLAHRFLGEYEMRRGRYDRAVASLDTALPYLERSGERAQVDMVVELHLQARMKTEKED